MQLRTGVSCNFGHLTLTCSCVLFGQCSSDKRGTIIDEFIGDGLFSKRSIRLSYSRSIFSIFPVVTFDGRRHWLTRTDSNVVRSRTAVSIARPKLTEQNLRSKTHECWYARQLT